MPKAIPIFLLMDLFLFFASCGVYAWRLLRRRPGRRAKKLQ
jgi:hypothetical protein